MADPTPEVLNALVRLMRGEIDYGDLSEETALAILAVCVDPRAARHHATQRLNRDGEGLSFAAIADRLREEFGVQRDKGTVARWASQPRPDGRLRRRGEGSSSDS